jgi:DNA topoisomerase-1
MGKPLLIVESPTKARTITRLLKGKYEVLASQGHVRDLPEKGLAVEITPDKQFIPVYELLPKKKAIVEKLKSAVSKADSVWLATDEDREGEAIAWHLCQALGINPEEPIRITFHEITERALQNALKNPRPISMSLVNAQQARRILDRLVGYKLSPLLWRAFPRAKGSSSKKPTALSAGRVQSAALRLIVEREEAIYHHQPTLSIEGRILVEAASPFWAKLVKPAFAQLSEAQALCSALVGRQLRITDIQKKEHQENPPPPFTTSTLQQEAQRKLGFSIRRTMMAAQALYEKGHITYMRTDSTHLAPEALRAIHEVIRQAFGENYLQPRDHSGKKQAFAQEAHEAIRPTDPSQREAGDTPDEKRLYQLIWSRTLASQMKPARYEKTRILLEADPPTNPPLVFSAEGERLVFEGFRRLYQIPREETEETPFPDLSKGQLYPWKEFILREKWSSPPTRYTEGTLVKELEERGIGRPSTYVPTIETLFRRNYIRRETVQTPLPAYRELHLFPSGQIEETSITPPPREEKNKLLPTDLGFLVTRFLSRHFPEIVDYDFTREMEEQLDHIASERADWQEVIRKFYEQFEPKVERLPTDPDLRQRLLGYDPVSQKPVYARYGKYGPYLQLGEDTDPEKRRANLPPNKRLETLSLEEALTLLSFPRLIGMHEGHPVEVHQGPYGYYLKYMGKNYKIPASYSPFSLSLEEAVEILTGNAVRSAGIVKQFPEKGIEVRMGRYGLFFTYGGKSYSLPKGTKVEGVTLELCEEVLARRQGEDSGKRPVRAVRKGR